MNGEEHLFAPPDAVPLPSLSGEPDMVYHTKVLFGTKKERNQWVFFVVKGIIGQRYYESDFWQSQSNELTIGQSGLTL